MKKQNILFLLIFVLVLSVSFVSAYQPETHVYIGEQACEIAPSSPICLLISQHHEDFVAGEVLADYSVFFYLDQGLNKISVKYLISHNYQFCSRAVAMASNDAELSFAYGLCSHEVSDNSAHNYFIPEMVRRTNMPQVLIHALSEEEVNDKVVRENPELRTEVRQALINKVSEHEDFLVRVVQSDTRTGDIDVKNMVETFSSQVIGSTKYSVGFRGFTAIPTSLHIFLILIFLFSLLVLVFILRIRKKNGLNKFFMWFSIVIIFFVLLAYILFFTGKIWWFFETFSGIFNIFLPTHGWEQYTDQAINNMVTFYNGGVTVLPSIIGDPSGQVALKQADRETSLVRWIVILFVLGLTALFTWLNFKRKRK